MYVLNGCSLVTVLHFFFFVVVVLFCVGYDAHILGFTCKLMLVLETVLNCMEVLIHS